MHGRTLTEHEQRILWEIEVRMRTTDARLDRMLRELVYGGRLRRTVSRWFGGGSAHPVT